jgi:hypothetical protein
MLTKQLPTVPGKVDGIVSLTQLIVQCRSCGDTYTGDDRVGVSIILSGYRFHTCEPGVGRMCPSCLTTVENACGRGRHR